MTAPQATRNAFPWLLAIVLAGYWLAVGRMLSPQWTVYVQYNYGWAVPGLCLYLLWRRWPNRPAVDKSKRAFAFVLLICCATLWLPTRIAVEANPIWRAASWAMAIELVGLTLCVIYLIGGRSWLRHFAFPVVFFLIAIPWPSQMENALVQSLMRANTTVVVEILSVLGVAALPHGNVIEISTGLVGIDEACSGIRSLQATLMIALFFGEFYRLRVSRRVGLLFAGIMLALICNVARTFTLVWVCHKSGISAMNRWHDPTGIAILLGCFTGLWVIAQRLFQAKVAAETTDHLPQLEAPTFPRYATWILLGSLIVTEGVNQAWFVRHENANRHGTKWSVRWPTDKSKLREVELSRLVREEMKFKDGRGMAWNESDGSAWQVYYFRWGPAATLLERVHVQFAKSHRPEICLPATGCILREDLGVKDFSVGELSLPFRAYRFEDRGLPLHVYFCAWEDGTHGGAANMRENTASRLAAAKSGSRSISQRVLEVAVWGYGNTREADAAFLQRLQELIQK